MAKTKTIASRIRSTAAAVSQRLRPDRGLVWENLAKSMACLALFFVPLLVGSWTNDTWELHKALFLVIVVGVGVNAWIFATLRRREHRWVWHPLDLLVIGFGVALVLSAALSVNWWYSLAGISGWHSHTLPVILSGVGLYVILSGAFRSAADRRMAWGSIIAGIAISLFIQMFHLAGVWILPDFAGQRQFSPLANSGTHVAILAAMFGAITLVLWNRKHERWMRLSVLAGTLLSWLIILFLSQPIGWTMFALGMVLVVVTHARDNRKADMTIVFAAILLAGLGLVAQFANITRWSNVPPTSEITLDQSTSARVAWETLKDRPVLGSGPATWYPNFVERRPTSFNQTPYWNVRFIQAGSEWWQQLAMYGVVGTLLLLAAMAMGVWIAWRHWTKSGEAMSMAAAVILIGAAISGIFSTWSLVLVVLVFAALGLTRSVATNGRTIKASATGPWAYGALAVSKLALLFFVIPGIGIYIGEIAFHGAQTAISNTRPLAEVQKKLSTAVLFSPQNTSAMMLQADAASVEAQLAAQQGNEAGARSALEKAANWLNRAIASDPENPVVYESANNYLNSVAGLQSGAVNNARQNFATLRRIEPASPIHDVGYGQTTLLLRESIVATDPTAAAKLLDEALSAFDSALAKKPEYTQARYAKTVALRDAGQFEAALRELDRITEVTDEQRAQLLVERGKLLDKLIRGDEAVNALNEAIALDPYLADAYLALADYYIAAGDTAKAKAALDQGKALLPADERLTQKISEL